jgi:SAM-dependent methyltransferase
MLEMARSQPAEVPVSWQEGSVLELPFADATFDLVLCQQGVQFFPDRAAGLREMARVLVPGGRLAVAAWAPIGQSPGFDALAVALERHVSAGAAAAARSPYALSDAGELRGLLAAAGLRDVAVDSRTMPVRFPSPAELVGQYVRSSPIAAVLGDVADAALEPVMREVAEALASYVDDRGLAFPTESHLARAVRPAPPVPPATG